MNDSEDLIIKFKNIAEQIHAFQSRRTSASIKKANKLVPILSDVFINIKSEGRSDELIRLLDDDNDGVRLEAAWRLLQFPKSYKQAKKILLDLSTSKEVDPLFISFTAEAALKNYENGTLPRDL